MSGLQPHERRIDIIAFQSQVFHFKPGVYRGGGKGEKCPGRRNHWGRRKVPTMSQVIS